MKSENLYDTNRTSVYEDYGEKDKTLHTLSMSQGDKAHIYNKWAETYDKYVQEEHYYGPRNLVSVIMNHIQSSEGSPLNILDFGCGTGLVGKEINAAFKSIDKEYNLTGIDISPGMILESKKLGIYNNLVCDNIVDKDLKITDVRKITSSEDGFDLIVSCGVFLEGHVPLGAISEVLLHLLRKSGGVLAVTIRDTFLNKSPNFRNELEKMECLGFKIVSFNQIEYLKGVKAWLLMISRNSI